MLVCTDFQIVSPTFVNRGQIERAVYHQREQCIISSRCSHPIFSVLDMKRKDMSRLWNVMTKQKKMLHQKMISLNCAAEI